MRPLLGANHEDVISLFVSLISRLQAGIFGAGRLLLAGQSVFTAPRY
jgi:hypothetical protein